MRSWPLPSSTSHSSFLIRTGRGDLAFCHRSGPFSLARSGNGRTDPSSLLILALADKFIQKTRKLYLDTRTQRNLSKLNSELNEVQNIMTKNIQEVLGQGEKLESRFHHSKSLSLSKCQDLGLTWV